MPTTKSTKPEKATNRAHLKLVFFYIVTFAALFTALVSYLNLLFAYINVKYPEALDYALTSSLNRIRLSTSILIVVWALYLFTQWLISKDLKNYKEFPANSGRKLLTYLTLLLATITTAVDLIVFIYNFYSGGFTAPFLLKVVSVLVVAVAVFEYYRYDLKQKFGTKTKVRKILGIIATVLLVASIAVGFFIVGSPAKQRNIRFDETRIQNLQEIQSQIISYWQLKGKLPATLADLDNSISGYQAPNDPETGTAYTYKVTATTKFTLCATFKTDGKYTNGIPVSKSIPLEGGFVGDTNDTWSYKVGESCYNRTIDPDYYKPSPKID